MELVIIRHGRTPGNAQKRYVGAVDQPLSEAGRAEALAAGVHADVPRVYVSPLRRTHETASIMFPNAEQVAIEGIGEMDFGAFAGRTADEMADDPAYRAWVESGCTSQCPGGEDMAGFCNRVCAALEQAVREADDRGERRMVVVAHGGTMMAALDRYADDPRSYWEWVSPNCGGYRIQVDLGEDGMRFTRVEDLGNPPSARSARGSSMR